MPGDPPERRLVGPPRPPEHVEDRERRPRPRCPAARPSSATPSERRHREQRTRCGAGATAARSPEMSASESDAAMTTAASVGCGRFRSSPGASTSISTIAAAPTTPVSCVLAPACSATAVREPLVLTGNPWKKPGARRWRRRCRSSPRSPSTSWPVRAANADAVEIVSVSETSAMPERAGDQQREVASTGLGTVSGGKPCGQRPDERDAVVAEVEAPTVAAIATTTATSTPGILRQPAPEHQDQRQADQRRSPAAAPTASPATPARRRTRAPRRSARRRRPRSRTASAAGRPGSSAPGRSCSRSASAWRAGRRRTRAWRRRPRS